MMMDSPNNIIIAFQVYKKLSPEERELVTNIALLHKEYIKQAIYIGITLYNDSNKSNHSWLNVIRTVSLAFKHTQPEGFAAYCADNLVLVCTQVREIDNNIIIYYSYKLTDEASVYYCMPAFRTYLRHIYWVFKQQEVTDSTSIPGKTLTHRLSLGIENKEDVIFGTSIYSNNKA